jgi:hypothetical protein
LPLLVTGGVCPLDATSPFLLAGGLTNARTLSCTQLDYLLKIWPLPRLPSPKNRGTDHRTYISYHPLFSTRFLHDGPINGVEWCVPPR